MADLNKQQKQIEKLLDQLNSISNRKYNIEFFNQGEITNVESANRLIAEIRDEIDSIAQTAKSTYNSFAGIVNELTKGKSTTQQIVKGTRDLFNISRNLYNSTEGVYNITVKQAKKEQEKAKIQFSNLKLLKEQVGKDTEKLRNLNGIINLENIFLNQLENQVREAQAIEDSLGATGAILDTFVNLPGLKQFSSYFKLGEVKEEMADLSRSIIDTIKETPEFSKEFLKQGKIITSTSDAIQGLNEEIESGKLTQDEVVKNEEEIARLKLEQEGAQEKITELNAKAAEQANTFANRTKVAVKGITSAVTNMAKGLTDPLAIFTMLVKAAGSVNKQTVGIQKSLGLSYDESLGVRQEMGDIALASEDTFTNVKRLNEAQAQFNEALGLQGKLNLDNSKTFAAITERLGASVESAAQLQLFAEATGNTFEDQKLASYEIAQSVSSQYGVQLNMKQVMDEVGQAGAYALVQNQGSVEALTEAVAKAKALGMTLQDVNSIAGKLLDFESSITSELQAELLIGRDINLERARLAALNNDQVTLMEEINSQMGDFSDFQNMNRIQQEAFAESLGMSVDQMSDMLLLEQYRGKNFETIAAEQGEEVAKRVEALSTQEKFNDAIAKMQDTLVNLVDGPLGNFANLIGKILESSFAINSIMGVIFGAQLLKGITGFVQLAGVFRKLKVLAKGTALANAAAFAVKNPFMAIAGVIAAGAAVAKLTGLLGKSEKGDDVLSKPQGASGGYGSRVLLGPEGAISLNNKDTVIAGTNLFRGNDIISAGAGSINIPPQDNKVGEQTNRLLSTLIRQNSKKPEMSPMNLYEIS